MKIRNYWQQPRCSKSNRLTVGHPPKNRVCSANLSASSVAKSTDFLLYCNSPDVAAYYNLLVHLAFSIDNIKSSYDGVKKGENGLAWWSFNHTDLAYCICCFFLSHVFCFDAALVIVDIIVLIIMFVVAVVMIVMIVVGCKCCRDCYCCQTKCQYADDTYCKKPVLNGVFHFFFWHQYARHKKHRIYWLINHGRLQT